MATTAGRLALLIHLVITVTSSELACPSYCECYTSRTHIVADCSSKMLATVPSGLPIDITGLRLGYNNLTELRNTSFQGKGVSLLERLELNDNLLSYIEPGVFQLVPRLTRLDLENNRIRHLHPDTFLPLASLWKLVLNGNPLELPKDGPFLVAPDLQVLELERCGIDDLPPHSFQNLSGLHTLRLTSNMLTSVNLRAFNLMHMAIGSNSVTDEGLMLDSPGLLVLDLSHCGLSRLPGNVLRTTPSLQRLKLERNSLISLDVDVLSAIPLVQKINLTENMITTLHADTFQHNGELTELDLSKNPIHFFADGGFIYSSSIQVLSLAACNLSRMTAETFRGVPNITHLKLSDNYLRHLNKETFNVLSNLRYLSVDGNRIFSLLPDFASGLSNLVSLDLSRNPLNIDPDVPILESNSLKELILDECYLETVPIVMLHHLPNITSLSLSKNLLSTIDVHTFEGATELMELAIDGNPLACNCTLLPLWQWCSFRQCEKSIVRCRRPRGRIWSVLSTLVCEEESVSPTEGYDVNLEVELVEITVPSRPPPERLVLNN